MAENIDDKNLKPNELEPVNGGGVSQSVLYQLHNPKESEMDKQRMREIERLRRENDALMPPVNT